MLASARPDYFHSRLFCANVRGHFLSQDVLRAVIAVYCPTQSLLQVLSRADLSDLDLHTCENWRHFERTKSRAMCSVMAVESLATDPAFRRYADSSHGAAAHPTVLVTKRDPENLRLIRNVPLQEVLWFEEAAYALGPAIHRAQGANHLQKVAEAIGESQQLPRRLRDALQHACRGSTPVRSIAQLAAHVGCNRSTLSRLWKRSVGPDAGLRLEDFLAWLIVLRALRQRSPGRKWSAVADDLDVPERTLRRLVGRWAGGNLRTLTVADYPSVAARFEDRILANPVRSNCHVLAATATSK